MAYRPVLPINGAAKVAASTVPAAPPTQATVPLELPHERDESVGNTDPPRRVIVQAKRDLDGGMVDTDMRATPGLDAEWRGRLVPGAGGKPPAGTA